MADSISSSQSSSRRPLGDALLELEPQPHHPKDSPCPEPRVWVVDSPVGSLNSQSQEILSEEPAAQQEAGDTFLTLRPRPPLLGRTSTEARETPFLTTRKHTAARSTQPWSKHAAGTPAQPFKEPGTWKSCAQRRRPGLGL